jgi:hypothetical protein
MGESEVAMRHIEHIHALVAMVLLSWPLAGQEGAAVDTGTLIRAYFNKMELGEIVGVQYTGEGRYVILATPKGNTFSNLWRDEVIQVARMALELEGEAENAVNFDFVRKASSEFRVDDILDPVGLGRTLGSTHPFALTLRELPEGARLAAALTANTAKTPDKRVLRQVVALLNRARQSELHIQANADFLSPATRVLLDAGAKERTRLNRMILEDFFTSVDRDVANHYVLQYSSPKAEALLRGSRTEAIVMAADSDLKHISGGSAGGEYAVGRSEVVLCGEQARADLQRGAEPHRGEYSTFFALSDLDYERMREGGIGAWLRNARLTTQAGRVTGETPECATRFAANLTRKTPHILEQDGEIPQHLRDLTTMLLLLRAVRFLAENSVPLSSERLARLSLDTTRLPNMPPKVVQVPLAIAANDRAILFSIAGGVQLGGGPAPLTAPQRAYTATETTSQDTPGFLVTTVQVEGRSLWAIDISSILAP